MFLTFLLFIISAFETSPDFGYTFPVELNSPYSFQLNQAYAQYNAFSIFCNIEQLYSIDDLTRYTSGASYGKENQIYSVYLSQFGNDLYREITTGFGLTTRFFNQDIGLRFKPMFLSIKNYGSKFIWSSDISMKTYLHDNVIIGFNSQNIFSSNYGERDNHPPVEYNFNVLINFLEDHTTSLSLSQLYNHPFRISTFHMISIKYMNFLIGLKTEPTEFSVGFDVNYMNIRTSYNISTHTELGYTHNISIAYQIKEEIVEYDRTIYLEADTLLTDIFIIDIFPIDINTADEELLQNIPGIGPVKAKRIIEYRESNGYFENIRDLLNIRGIGEVFLENITPYIIILGI